jgi:hypothetical protein
MQFNFEEELSYFPPRAFYSRTTKSKSLVAFGPPNYTRCWALIKSDHILYTMKLIMKGPLAILVSFFKDFFLERKYDLFLEFIIFRW